MRVHYSLDEIPPIKRPVLTLGTFDGVHLGHQEIIQFLKKTAKKVSGETVLFTFHPHPRMVLHPDDHGLQLIQSIDERIHHLRQAGIDHLILIPFTEEFARQTATEFVRNILVNLLKVHTLTIGYNHHFGRNREGSLDLLNELAPVYGFDVIEIPAVRQDEKSISSTKIREAIKSGDIKTANRFLGRNFGFSGLIVKGDQLGSTIGYPTANLKTPEPLQITPDVGVFAVKIRLNGLIYDGMMNIGNRPTVSDSGEKRLEVHIFDFDGDLYGLIIDVFFVDRIREEKAFSSLDDLKEQLKKDEINCRRILEHSAVHIG